MKIHLLDMGSVMYGDSIVITHGKKSILIDGAHQGDYNSLLRQFQQIFEKEGPYEFDLLIMTHCHDDHIGCLPTLIGNGDVKFKKALLADPVYRWGKDGGLDAATREPFIDALFEEDHSELDDADLAQFLFDSEQLPIRYDRMIQTLKKQKVPVKLYQGNDKVSYAALEKEFKTFGLKILGPTHKQLTITQSSLLDATVETHKFIDQSNQTDDIKTATDLYRKIFAESTIDNAIFLDAKKNKGAINNHSIVIKVAAEGWSALLAGDMQFANAEVSGLEEDMKALLEKVNKAGPYDFIKTSHHTSYNGLNEAMLDEWLKQGTKLFAHSGGKKDDKHPEKSVLQLLKARQDEFEFARTDRNGIITIAKVNGKVTMDVEKSKKNIFTLNPKPVRGDTEATSAAVPSAPVAATPVVTVQKTPLASGTNIMVTATFAIGAGPVTITVDTEKKKDNQPISSGSTDVPNNASRFSNLLFVVCSEALSRNIGAAGSQRVMSKIQGFSGSSFIDIPFTPNCLEAAELVRKHISSTTKAVVLVGGYDIIPSLQFNLLNDEMREAVRKETIDKNQREDPDNFIIWSDDIYGDTIGDFLPEFPVSRIPDGKSEDLMLAALEAPSFAFSGRFGIHNFRRPFAVDIFEKIPYKLGSKLEASELFQSSGAGSNVATGAVYFMLHGSDRDATRFTGESSKRGHYLEAFEINNVPQLCAGTVVFSGCCWGGLVVQPIAQFVDPGIPLRNRTAQDSIAMAYLRGGANAFVGCTGAHYSPARVNENFFGKPMHDAFWTEIKKGRSAADALFHAKKQYSVNMPHGLEDSPLALAVEMKSLHQFTCLGLGW